MASKVDAVLVSCRTGQGDSECGHTLGVKLSGSVEETIVLHIHKEGKMT